MIDGANSKATDAISKLSQVKMRRSALMRSPQQKVVCYKSGMINNQKAKLEAIMTYLDDAKAKVVFVDELAKTGHKDEAMTLSLVYIDRFAQLLCWPSELTGYNFVKALVEFGQDPLMQLAHPLQARRAFAQIRRLQTLAEHIAKAFPGPTYEVMPIPNFEAVLKPITGTEFSRLEKEVWRATIASVAYQHLRNPAVHGFGVSGGLDFSQTTYDGNAIPTLGYFRLRNCALALIAELRRRSEANGQWFGNDEIVRGP